MKLIISLLLLALGSCASGKEIQYTGSTPPCPSIRSFLGISPADSIDFIRWKLSIDDSRYTLLCHYGIGKPNTNGFMNGGNKVQLDGTVRKEKNYYYLQKNNKTLRLLVLNDNLLHFLDENNKPLAGTGGFAFTLSNEQPVSSDNLAVRLPAPVLKDSMVFHGRTPCKGLAVYPEGSPCYKLKWLVVLFADPRTNQPATYRLRGTAFNNQSKTGNWTIIHGKDGRTIFRLNNAMRPAGDAPLYLLWVDDNVLVFTDEAGNLLVGNEDFSYTLSRRQSGRQ